MSGPCSDDQQTEGIDGEPDATDDNGENDGNFWLLITYLLIDSCTKHFRSTCIIKTSLKSNAHKLCQQQTANVSFN